MARDSTKVNVTGGTGSNAVAANPTLGTSSSGDFVLEIDNAKVKTLTKLRELMAAAYLEIAGRGNLTP